jgi:hypothetical protein
MAINKEEGNKQRNQPTKEEGAKSDSSLLLVYNNGTTSYSQ